MKATIWVCPTEGCGDYYGSSSTGDLRESWNQDAKGKRTFPRSRCPNCRARGIDVDRVPVTVVIPQP